MKRIKQLNQNLILKQVSSLTVAVAYKHLRDKMKKEEEKKKNPTMTGKKPTKIDTKPEVEFDK